MRAGKIPLISHSRTMVMSLSVICAVVISLLFSDCAIMTAATHVSPLSSGMSSESSEDPMQLEAYGCSGSVELLFVLGAHVPSHIEDIVTNHQHCHAARQVYV